jgi:hypothetical protein
MTDTIEGVEREGSGEDDLSSVLNTLREARNYLDDMLAVECTRSDEVGDGESVEH